MIKHLKTIFQIPNCTNKKVGRVERERRRGRKERRGE
jgi:predicted RNA-binding Zn-ribbon protein involved in translation (DUF1610 family)